MLYEVITLNVCSIVVAQAATLGIPEDRLQEIGLAALLHDIGKEKVPSEILQKPGKIDPQEFARMAEHPALGANILVITSYSIHYTKLYD